MSKRGGRGGGILYVQQDAPKFLKQFKERVGYKEGPDVNTKREVLNREDIDDGEQEDEQPTIVVLKKGDLTHEEVERLRDDKGDLELDNTDIPDKDEESEEEEPPADGRIVFKRPKKKRSQNKESDLNASSKKLKTDKSEKKKTSAKKVVSSSLLSFGDDEENEDDA